MRILNLYAGIGGNRKLWGDEHYVTAVENVPEIADVYKRFFPNDTVLVEDAHEYLIKHFQEYDFIWSSPPVPISFCNEPFSEGTRDIPLPRYAVVPRDYFPQALLQREVCCRERAWVLQATH